MLLVRGLALLKSLSVFTQQVNSKSFLILTTEWTELLVESINQIVKCLVNCVLTLLFLPFTTKALYRRKVDKSLKPKVLLNQTMLKPIAGLVHCMSQHLIKGEPVSLALHSGCLE